MSSYSIKANSNGGLSCSASKKRRRACPRSKRSSSIIARKVTKRPAYLYVKCLFSSFLLYIQDLFLFSTTDSTEMCFFLQKENFRVYSTFTGRQVKECNLVGSSRSRILCHGSWTSYLLVVSREDGFDSTEPPSICILCQSIAPKLANIERRLCEKEKGTERKRMRQLEGRTQGEDIHKLGISHYHDLYTLTY